MPLTLYGAILSPFVRKIRVQLAEQDIPHEHVAVGPFQQPDWFYQISPLGRIPAIQDGDLRLADSAVIAQYLQDKYAGPSLYGESPEEAAQIRWLEKYADYELAPHATFSVYSERFLHPLIGQQTNEERVATALQQKLPPLFDYLEHTLGDKPYMVGNAFSLADIAVCSQLINMAHVGELIDDSTWPGLASLLSRVTARSSFSSLLPAEHQLIAKLTNRHQ